MSDAVELKAAIEILQESVAKLAESQGKVCVALSRDFNVGVQTKREIGQVMESIGPEGALMNRLMQAKAHLNKVR